jgi:hypothetical protein
MTEYKEKVMDVLNNSEKYHYSFYSAEVFHGPSLYFHRRTIEARKTEPFNLYLEYIYATLAAWGMHRMGKGGSKMVRFEIFQESIELVKEKIRLAEQMDYKEIKKGDWDILENIFKSIKIMASGTSIIGNSKVMAHLIPNLIPPIDREYTLRYLRGNTNIKNGLDYEWDLFKNILEGFFVPIACDAQFIMTANDWLVNQTMYPWDTSIFKIIDNLVIGARKTEANQ